jgi:hypothetical protein
MKFNPALKTRHLNDQNTKVKGKAVPFQVAQRVPGS